MTKADGSLKFDTKIDDAGFNSGMSKIGGIAAKAMAAMSTAAVGLSGYAIKVGADFQAGMSEVAAISDASADDVQRLTDKAKEMGIVTKFSATEASAAMKYMAMAGWDASQMVDGISGIMNLAAASGEELASVSDIVTDALTAFGLQAKDSAHFADVLAKAASSSNTNVGMMGETFKYAAPLAGTLGYSVEDTAVAIGLMANAGIKGSQAGTAMRGMLTRLIKPTDEVQGAMDALGITISNADGTIKPFNQLMKEMRLAFADLTDEEKAQRAASLAGQEAMSGFLAIINASDSDFEKLSNSINNADGTAQKMADTMNDNLKGSITLLGSSLEGLGIAAFDHFEKPLSKAVKGAMDKVNDLSRSMSSGKLSKSMSKVADGFGTIVETVLDLATTALPMLVDSFAFLIDNGKKIIPILTGIGSGMVAMKGYQKYIMPFKRGFDEARLSLKLFETANNGLTIAQGALNGSFKASEILVGVLTGKITLATAAQSALNAAQSLSPHVWLIAGIAGVTAGLTGLAFALKDSNGEIRELWNSIEETKNTWDELNVTQEETLTTEMSQIDNIQKLRDELKYLVEDNGKVKKGYEARASFILGELNTALGTEYSMTGNVIDKYDELNSSIDTLIQKKRTKAILDAQEPLYQEAINKQMEEAIEIGKLKNEISKDEAELQRIENELIAEYGENFRDSAYKAKDSRATEYDNLVAHISEKEAVLKGFEENYNAHTNTIIAYENNMTLAASKSADDWAKIQTGNIAITATTYEEKRKILNEEILGAEHHYENLKKRYKNGEEGVTKSMVEEAEKRLNEKKEELKGITEAVIGFVPGVVEQYREASLKSLEAYKSKSKEYFGVSAKEMDDLVAGLKSKDPKVQKKAQETASMMIRNLSSKNDESSQIGIEIIQGIANGLDIKSESLFIKSSSIALNIAKSFKDALKIKSPSRVFAALAAFIPEGIAVGIDKAVPVALKAVKAMGGAMGDEMSECNNSFSDAFSMKSSFQKLRNVAMNRMQYIGNTAQPTSTVANSQQTKTKLEIVDRSQNSYSLVLENGAELAHWLAPHMNRELGMLKG